MDDTLYLFVSKHIYTVDISLMHSGVLIHPNGVDTMMTLDAAKWNGTGGELSSCVINTSIRSCVIIFGTNLPVDFLSFFCNVCCSSMAPDDTAYKW